MNTAYDTACAEWAEQLALRPDDLAPGDRSAFEAHVACCQACQAVRQEFGRIADQIQALPDPVPAADAPRWLAHARRASSPPSPWYVGGLRWLAASTRVAVAWSGDRRLASSHRLSLRNTRSGVAGKRQHSMNPLRKALLLPVPLCLALAISSLCVQLGQLAGFGLLGVLCALLVYPGIALPLLLRLLRPIRFRPLLTLRGKLVGIPTLLVTASCAGFSWFSLTAPPGAPLGRWEVQGWCGLISTTCLVLAAV